MGSFEVVYLSSATKTIASRVTFVNAQQRPIMNFTSRHGITSRLALRSPHSTELT